MSPSLRAHIRILESGSVRIRTVHARKRIPDTQKTLSAVHMCKRVKLIKAQMDQGYSASQISDYLKIPYTAVAEYVRRLRGLRPCAMNHKRKR